ncbi:hypothetical protein [Thermococcus peptonophilus]|uniref:hypothetical protein n=1 Tax=Thermococcus peptonophilus TaxID=53952 RepID=UPI000B2EB9B8
MLIGNLIPLLAITTSYIGISLAQQSNNEEFVKLKRPVAWALTVIPPGHRLLRSVRNFADVLASRGGHGRHARLHSAPNPDAGGSQSKALKVSASFLFPFSKC